jgi:hypothetical protein
MRRRSAETGRRSEWWSTDPTLARKVPRPTPVEPAQLPFRSAYRPHGSTIVTLPTPSSPLTPIPAMPTVPAPPAAPVRFPLRWMLEQAASPLQYRALTEVARMASLDSKATSALPLAHRPAITLAVQQSPDGSWNHSMLTLPSGKNASTHFTGIGTIHAVRRLLEYGWDRDTPPLACAKRLLFRLLAEDEDPDYLFELEGETHGDDDLIRRGRAILREASAAVLAQAGYENDPRLRGAAGRMMARVGDFLRSPLATKPFVRVGNQHVLPPEATPPSIYGLHMLAWMPLFRTEHHDTVERLYQYLTQPLPRSELVQQCGNHIVAQPHLVMGDFLPHRNAADEDVPASLMWLELMARLGFLRRNENWCRLLDRFIEDRDDRGVWHPHKGTATAQSNNPFTWAYYPLEESQSGEERWTDATFRLGLIARLSGRTIELE